MKKIDRRSLLKSVVAISVASSLPAISPAGPRDYAVIPGDKFILTVRHQDGSKSTREFSIVRAGNIRIDGCKVITSYLFAGVGMVLYGVDSIKQLTAPKKLQQAVLA